MYTATQALAELDKFPIFRAELADLLELGRELYKSPRQFELIAKIAGRAASLGSMVELRDRDTPPRRGEGAKTCR